MYVLCKLDRAINDSKSIYYHPLSPVFKSDDMKLISAEIMKRVTDGCPAKNLMVFEEVNFEVMCTVKYE